MRILTGLFWILGGGLAGCIVAVIAAFVINAVASPSHRDGALGYLVFLLGFVGALIGMVVGLGMYGRSAPAGEIGAFLKAGAIGFVAFAALIVIVVGAYLNLREEELQYNNAAVYLLMELRVANSPVAATREPRWFQVEMESPNPIQPSANVHWHEVRTEANHAVYPSLFSPMQRSKYRKVFVRVGNQQVETFAPQLGRRPKLMTDWSPWLRPVSVDAPYGFVAQGPLQPMFELRYQVKGYNQSEGSAEIDGPWFFEKIRNFIPELF